MSVLEMRRWREVISIFEEIRAAFPFLRLEVVIFYDFDISKGDLFAGERL